ncbi:UNVERIFIED_CONTAM: hypothetical protein Sradi_4188800 [Sesamum radiatum]|uniref:Uncharacterized protein n=1 Tax=Sesamum radiatum TaxID=300843 RepID=A0AAW2P6K3_SESRA
MQGNHNSHPLLCRSFGIHKRHKGWKTLSCSSFNSATSSFLEDTCFVSIDTLSMESLSCWKVESQRPSLALPNNVIMRLLLGGDKLNRFLWRVDMTTGSDRVSAQLMEMFSTTCEQLILFSNSSGPKEATALMSRSFWRERLKVC